MRRYWMAVMAAVFCFAAIGEAAAAWKTQAGTGVHTKKRYGVAYSLVAFGFMTDDLSEIAIYCFKDNPMYATLGWDLEEVTDPDFLTGEIEIDVDGYDNVRATLEKRFSKKTGFTMTIPAGSPMLFGFVGALLDARHARINAFTQGGNDTDWSLHDLGGFKAAFSEACSWHEEYPDFTR